MLLMNLYVLTEFRLNVFVIINLDAGDELSGINVPRDSIFRRKNVQPEVASADHLDGKHGWEFLERKGVVDTSTPFFQGTDTTLDHGDMLFAGAFI